MAIHGNEDPPAGPVDCHKEISPRRFIGHVWRVFHVNLDIAGLKCFQATVLRFVLLGCTVTKASRSMPTQTGSRPERDIVGFRNSRTTANRSTSDSRHVLRSASPPQPVALWSGWSEDGVGCGVGGCDPEHCLACVISSQSVQWLRGGLPRSTQVHHAPEWPPVLWCRCRLAITSNKHWCRPSEYAHSTDLARKSAKRRRSMWSSGTEHLACEKSLRSALRKSALQSWTAECRLCGAHGNGLIASLEK